MVTRSAGNLGRMVRGEVGSCVQHLIDDINQGQTFKGWLAGQHFVKDRTEGIDVGCRPGSPSQTHEPARAPCRMGFPS